MVHTILAGNALSTGVVASLVAKATAKETPRLLTFRSDQLQGLRSLAHRFNTDGVLQSSCDDSHPITKQYRLVVFGHTLSDL